MTAERTVAALFVRADSVYKTMPDVDAWDIERDARKWPGGCPIVAHPPCRAWARLRQFAKPRPDEKELARWAVRMVRQWGGVLEHPATSTLWQDQKLAGPGEIDAFGGRCIQVDQHRFGHRAEKLTRFYIVGRRYPELIESLPPRAPGPVRFVVTGSHGIRFGHPRWRPEITKPEREHTPPELARWLVDLARRCRVSAEAAC